MNRLATRHNISRIHSHLVTPRHESQISNDCDQGCHATFAPLHYEQGYSYPLVVWLHSPGGDERELSRIMPLVSERNYVGVSARGTATFDHTAFDNNAACGYDWRQSEDHIFLAQQRVMSSIALAKRKFCIDPSRVFLAGYQSGGTMALRLAMARPEFFAGALSVGGAFPTGHAPLNRYADARRMPVFLTSCRDSQVYPETRVCQDLRLLHAAGIQVTLRQYPCGDEMTTNMLSDMNEWVMELLSKSTASVIR